MENERDGIKELGTNIDPVLSLALQCPLVKISGNFLISTYIQNAETCYIILRLPFNQLTIVLGFTLTKPNK